MCIYNYDRCRGFNVDDVVIDLFYWFEKSTNRKAGLVEYCGFCYIDYRQICEACQYPMAELRMSYF